MNIKKIFICLLCLMNMSCSTNSNLSSTSYVSSLLESSYEIESIVNSSDQYISSYKSSISSLTWNNNSAYINLGNGIFQDETTYKKLDGKSGIWKITDIITYENNVEKHWNDEVENNRYIVNDDDSITGYYVKTNYSEIENSKIYVRLHYLYDLCFKINNGGEIRTSRNFFVTDFGDYTNRHDLIDNLTNNKYCYYDTTHFDISNTLYGRSGIYLFGMFIENGRIHVVSKMYPVSNLVIHSLYGFDLIYTGDVDWNAEPYYTEFICEFSEPLEK